MYFKEGTRTKRCDLCTRWTAFSSTRVLGWCTRISPAPEVLGFKLIMERLPDDPISAYNQVCDHIELSARGIEMNNEQTD